MESDQGNPDEHGILIQFPEQRVPYPAQAMIMEKVKSAAVKGQNALFQSPTGTGKTLALLSSTIATTRYMRMHYRIKVRQVNDFESSASESDADFEDRRVVLYQRVDSDGGGLEMLG